MAPTPFADAAVAYARNGWRVFKIPPGQKIPRDRWLNGEAFEVATADLGEIARRAQQFPGHNIGIATGNGLAVLDIDPRHGGKVPEWARETATVSTPNGGVHLYYQVDGPVRSSQGVLAPGVDVRGDGGMVLAPPSVIHADIPLDSGAVRKAALVYEWVAEGAKVARLSAALLNPPERREGRATLSGSFGEGERHRAMLSLAGVMRSKGCEFPEIQAALRALNESRFKPPLEVQWVDKMAKSIMQYSPDHDLLS